MKSAILVRPTLTPRAQRRAGVAAGGLDPVAELGLGQDVAEDHRGGDEPEQRHVDAERPDIEVGNQDIRQPLIAGVPGPLREAIGDEQRGAADHQKHAERDEEGGDFQARHEQPVHQPDEGGDHHGDEEADEQRHDALIEQGPHHDGREAEDRADRQVEFAGGHQERHRQRDQPELDREGQRVADVERRQEVVVDRPEDDELEDEQNEGAEFRPGDQPSDERGRFHEGDAFRAWCLCFRGARETAA